MSQHRRVRDDALGQLHELAAERLDPITAKQLASTLHTFVAAQIDMTLEILDKRERARGAAHASAAEETARQGAPAQSIVRDLPLLLDLASIEASTDPSHVVQVWEPKARFIHVGTASAFPGRVFISVGPGPFDGETARFSPAIAREIARRLNAAADNAESQR